MEPTIPTYADIPLTPTYRPMLVGLCSPAMGSGKTEVSRLLEVNHSFVRNPLAQTLKEMTATFFVGMGLDIYDAWELIRDPELKEAPIKELKGVTPRHLMQTLGTEWGRNCIHESVWVDVCLARSKHLMRQGRSVVIDDVRFTNEADAIRDAGGVIVRVVRPGVQRTTSHASEGQLDSYKVDYQLVNDSTLSNLTYKVRNLFDDIKSRQIN